MRGLILVTIRFGFAFAPQLAIAQASGVVQGDAPIVAPGAKLERLFGEGFFTEGPAPAPDGSVYFSDITVGKASGYQAGYIWRWDPQTRTSTVFRSPSGMSNGMLFDAQGRLVVAEGAWFGGRRITRTDMKTGKSVILAALFDGRPFNSPNDVALDARGRIYFTDPRYVGWEPIEQPVQGVYRIDPDGRVSLVAADAGKPNGIAVSPDQATLYVGANDNGSLGDLPPETPAAPGRKALLAYDLAPDGSAKFRRAVVDFSPAGPDGITVDREGNIYCAVQGERQGIYAYSPAGKELAYIPTAESPTNVKFGRAGDAQTLFITAGKSLYRIRVERTGVTRE
ncbi:MAG TPA: SMP-30/gluconolactonase/LRE family protein [Gemmatimonadales bacterium]|nr:SMP-30/gluconolactonase/LRE family protein [Gemmatimonadales bacterium]